MGWVPYNANLKYLIYMAYWNASVPAIAGVALTEYTCTCMSIVTDNAVPVVGVDVRLRHHIYMYRDPRVQNSPGCFTQIKSALTRFN